MQQHKVQGSKRLGRRGEVPPWRGGPRHERAGLRILGRQSIALHPMQHIIDTNMMRSDWWINLESTLHLAGPGRCELVDVRDSVFAAASSIVHARPVTLGPSRGQR